MIDIDAICNYLHNYKENFYYEHGFDPKVFYLPDPVVKAYRTELDPVNRWRSINWNQNSMPILLFQGIPVRSFFDNAL